MNPILNALTQNSRLNDVMRLANAIQNKNADDLLAQEVRENPHFRDFVNKYRNTKPEDILRENGLNPSILSQLK